jgi:hypothetical protein
MMVCTSSWQYNRKYPVKKNPAGWPVIHRILSGTMADMEDSPESPGPGTAGFATTTSRPFLGHHRPLALNSVTRSFQQTGKNSPKKFQTRSKFFRFAPARPPFSMRPKTP